MSSSHLCKAFSVSLQLFLYQCEIHCIVRYDCKSVQCIGVRSIMCIPDHIQWMGRPSLSSSCQQETHPEVINHCLWFFHLDLFFFCSETPPLLFSSSFWPPVLASGWAHTLSSARAWLLVWLKVEAQSGAMTKVMHAQWLLALQMFTTWIKVCDVKKKCEKNLRITKL